MHELQISEIQIMHVLPRGGLVAFASCVINGFLYIGDIAIYSSLARSDGYRLVYPSKTLPTRKEINCVHPTNKEAEELISRAVIKKYREIVSKATG